MRNFLFLLAIFLLAIAIRFLYFPDNIYFSYDHARDAFASLQILSGHFRLIGPPSSFNTSLFHSPLTYYLFAPIYFLAGKDPTGLAIFLRVFNSLGIFLTFALGSILFNKKVGFLSAIFFAFSFEQTQYAIFLTHPTLSAVTVLLFYLGLSMAIFQKKPWGLPLALLGWGLSINSHYVYILLGIPFSLSLAFFHKSFTSIKLKYWFLSLAIFILMLSSFILAEIKFHLLSQAFKDFHSRTMGGFGFVASILQRISRDTFGIAGTLGTVVAIILPLGILILNWSKPQQGKILFLLIWLLGGLVPYFLATDPSYYFSASSTVSLFILTAFIIYYLSRKYLFLAIALIILILAANLNSIVSQNKNGPNSDFLIQPKMLLSDEKKIIDYIYQNANGQPFAVSAVSVPLSIKTTWNYLFEWYGQSKYHYLPTWIGPTALGFAGNIPEEVARSKLPEKQFLIIEPTIGIRSDVFDEIFKNESYFATLAEEKKIGTFRVQIRKPF